MKKDNQIPLLNKDPNVEQSYSGQEYNDNLRSQITIENLRIMSELYSSLPPSPKIREQFKQEVSV